LPNMQTTARWGVVDPSGARPARQHCRCRCQRPRAHGSRLCAHREGCEERLSLYLLEPPTAPSGGRPASDDSCELRGARSAPNEAGSAGWLGAVGRAPRWPGAGCLGLRGLCSGQRARRFRRGSGRSRRAVNPDSEDAPAFAHRWPPPAGRPPPHHPAPPAGVGAPAAATPTLAPSGTGANAAGCAAAGASAGVLGVAPLVTES
jgi:hypothetical protein